MIGAEITKDFNGLPIVFREDGYINMTKALKGFPGKRLDKFWWNEGTHDYIVALHKALTNTTYSGDWSDEEWQAARDALVVAKRGGRKGEAGTWCHPKLAVFFARWLDVRFAV